MYIGVDIGGTTIKAGLLNDDFEVVKRYWRDTGATRKTDDIAADIITVVRKSLADASEPVPYVGIGCPGHIDAKHGVVRASANINFGKNYNLAYRVEQAIGLPVMMENDANCAAIAEHRTGAVQDVDSFVMLTLGTGVGGAVVVKGNIVSGFSNHAGEIGQQIISLDLGNSSIAQEARFEYYASATALIRQAAEEAKREPASQLAILMEDGGLSGERIFRCMQQGCPVAQKVVERYCFYLAVGIHNMIMLLEPEVVLLGGGIAKAGKILLDMLQSYQTSLFQSTAIRIAKHSADAGIIGAAMLGITT